jgi:hypothetical protein
MGWELDCTQRLTVGVATLAAAASAWWLYLGTHPLRDETLGLRYGCGDGMGGLEIR